MNTKTNKKERRAVSDLLSALDRLIAAAKEAEKARERLVSESQTEGRRHD